MYHDMKKYIDNVFSTGAPRGPGPVLQIYIYPRASVPIIDNMPSSCACDVHTHLACVPCMCVCVCVCVCVYVCVLCAVQCCTEMSPIVTTDWVPGLEGILVASSLTLLLSRVFTRCRDFTAIKRVHHVGSIANCARKPGARSMFSACTTAHYRALLTGSPPGPGATLANIYIYIYLQYGAWATSKTLPCLHKACYTTTGLLAMPTQTTGVQAVPIRASATSRQVAC